MIVYMIINIRDASIIREIRDITDHRDLRVIRDMSECDTRDKRY